MLAFFALATPNKHALTPSEPADVLEETAGVIDVVMSAAQQAALDYALKRKAQRAERLSEEAGAEAASGEEASPRRLRPFMICGQSNVDGCGRINDLGPSMRARLRAVSDRVTIVHNDGKPYHLCEGGCPSASCFGPELALALTVAEADPTAEVLVVKQAGSGEALTDELHSSAGLTLAGELNTRETDRPTLSRDGMCALAAATLHEVTRTVFESETPAEAAFWIQGEGDTRAGWVMDLSTGQYSFSDVGDEGAARYADNLRLLVQALRIGMRPLHPNQLLVGVVDSHRSTSSSCVANASEWRRGQQISSAKARVGNELERVVFLPNSYDASSPLFMPTWCNVTLPDGREGPEASNHFLDCPCGPGHFSTEGQLRLGVRMAHAVLFQ
jgi:hypothetical protein